MKSVVSELPPDYEETILGDKMGALRQFRGRSGFHVREYEDRFVFHRDCRDPRKDPMGHLIHDSPETLLALGASLNLARKASQANKRTNFAFSPLVFLFAFFSLNFIFRRLKHLIFS
ncbi:MAG: hypothetical protein ACYC7D_13170 [Nitrososphaerales archaeon]